MVGGLLAVSWRGGLVRCQECDKMGLNQKGKEKAKRDDVIQALRVRKGGRQVLEGSGTKCRAEKYEVVAGKADRRKLKEGAGEEWDQSQRQRQQSKTIHTIS
eukprot:CAMPEP_0113661868 /NCGR_PEP_ID=MMETSP0038_2-20120614/234_1 /TAXON_ID=2898 /ORGANISM="Cryptomonas paramecium" /LENGTH=101 /DNA_ID=CAMNT_0000576649 /DNA_START=634 /DNA_END=939 /DNA_ORIENTATION=- /assembly_acc=CAM_ASM_000170